MFQVTNMESSYGVKSNLYNLIVLRSRKQGKHKSCTTVQGNPQLITETHSSSSLHQLVYNRTQFVLFKDSCT